MTITNVASSSDAHDFESLSFTEGTAIEQAKSSASDVEHQQEEKDAASTTSDDDELSEEDLRARRAARNKKIVIGVLLVAFVIFVVVDSLTTGYVRSGIDSFLQWIEANPIPGFFVFMVVYLVATVLFVPGSILTLGAGFVFANAFGLGPGVLLGSLSVFFGASAGAIVSFILGRYLLRDWVKTLTKKYAVFEALDVALEEKGFRIMALLRLSPIIPFNAINYIGGVTAISLSAYCLSLVAILPGTVLYVFLGASAGSLADSSGSGDNSTVTIAVVVVGAVFGIFAIFVTSYYAKKELNRVIEAREQAKLGEESEDNDMEADRSVGAAEVAISTV